MKDLTSDQMLALSMVCTTIDAIAADLDVEPLELIHYISEIIVAVNDENGHIYAN